MRCPVHPTSPKQGDRTDEVSARDVALKVKAEVPQGECVGKMCLVRFVSCKNKFFGELLLWS